MKTIMTIAKKKPFRWNISPQPLLQWHMDFTNPSGNGAPPGGAGRTSVLSPYQHMRGVPVWLMRYRTPR